jgi:hypothetical protein
LSTRRLKADCQSAAECHPAPHNGSRFLKMFEAGA